MKKNKAYNFLNRLSADVFVMSTPGLDVLQIKRNRGVAHYCHIVHSLTPMTYRVFGVDYFDSVLVANTTQKNFIRDIESAHQVKAKHIAITGSTYLDELYKLRLGLTCETNGKSSSTQDSIPTILISSSWGKESLLSKYGLALLLPLAQSGFHIIIRPHPQSFIASNEKANIQELQNVLATFSNVSWDSNMPNVYAFLKANMMISDFSSVIFDFICLENKPVLTIDNEMDLSGYDMADIAREDIWTLKVLERIGGRVKSTDFPRIKEICEKALKQTPQLDEIKTLLWQYPLSSGVVSALELLKIEREIIESKLKPHMPSVARLRELDKMLGKMNEIEGVK